MHASDYERWDLTAGQLEIWHAQKLARESSLYNTSEYLEITGTLDIGLFETALHLTIREAEGARMRLSREGELPQQYFPDLDDWRLNFIDVSSAKDQHAAAMEWMQEDMRRPVDLAEDWLFTTALFKAGPQKFFWYYRAHHIALDGFSASIIAARQAQIYTSLLVGRSPASGALGPVSVLLASEAEYRNSAEFQGDREFWLDVLSDVPQAISMSGQRPRGIPQIPVRDMTDFDPQDAELFAAAARRVRTSTSGLLIAAAAIYQHRCSGGEDVVLGLSVLGRTGRLQRKIPGMTANVLPIRLKICHETSLDELARQVSTTVSGALKHQRYRFEDMRRDLGLANVGSLFNLIINVMAFDYAMKFGDCSVIPHELTSTPVNDLRIAAYIRPSDGGMQIAFDTNPDVYETVSGRDMGRRFRTVLDWVARAEPGDCIGNAEIMSAVERRQVIEERNDTAVSVPGGGVHQLVEVQAASCPDAVAVAFAGLWLSYAELEGRANRLAHYLLEAGAGPETVVGLCLPRGIQLVIAILAAWKTGAAYLPLDPGYPPGRLAFMLADSQAGLLVSTGTVLDELPGGRLRTIALDDPVVAAAMDNYPAMPPPRVVAADQLAYVIYTSGSTGAPKAVAVTHGGLVNYVTQVPGRVGLGEPGRRYALLQAQSTDLGNTVVFGCLASGGQLHVLARDTVNDPVLMARYLSCCAIDYLKVVPSHLAALAGAAGMTEVLPSRSLVLGGEAASPEWIREVLAAAGTRKVFNHYGPTETTIGVVTGPLAGHTGSTVPIGSPVANTQVFVLNRRLRAGT